MPMACSLLLRAPSAECRYKARKILPTLPRRRLAATLFCVRPYEEIVNFIASLSPRDVVGFKPSQSARERAWELIERQKSAPLPAEEKAELDHYLEVEHLMRLAKARARQLLAHA